ncbi:MAG: formyltetrahydrofolate deformylase [Acidimicrobiales bacterium]|jgi:formyltetrahydrofolate deformylase
MPDPATARLLLSAPDRPGLAAAVAGFVAGHNGSIVEADQYTDAEVGVFFQRVEFTLDGFDLDRGQIDGGLRTVTDPLGMDVHVRYSDEVRRIGILVSRQVHCLYDLLARSCEGVLPAEVAFVAGNHPDCAEAAGRFGIPFHHLPVSDRNRAEQEAAIGDLADAAGVELLVMAKYMQILTPEFCERFASRVINIHHSFLPAFAGARPYHQAYDRGVKVIGVTGHYATADLDQGPIIDQAVTPVSHRDGPSDLIRMGRDLETVVLARAVRLHLTDRVLVHGRKTVVFT